MEKILAIDIGTTGVTLGLVDCRGRLLWTETAALKIRTPQPGWVEQNPQDFLKVTAQLVKKSFKKHSVKKSEILSIGLTNQRETSLMWDSKTGEALGPAISWQCKRTLSELKKLKHSSKDVKRKTGLSLDPYFSAQKMNWLKKHGSAKNNFCLGTVDSYILWHLTGGDSFFTDTTNASRTSLMNIDKLSWDKDLLKLFKIPGASLAEIKSTADHFGAVRSFIPELNELPVQAMIGDQQSSLFGLGVFKKNHLKITMGTGAFALMNTGYLRVRPKSSLLSTVAWSIKGKTTYALEGSAFICGALLDWLAQDLGLAQNTKELLGLIEQLLPRKNLRVMPYLSGMGAPHWIPEVQGAILGLTRGVKPQDIVLGALYSLALQNLDLLEAFEKESAQSIKKIYFDGGVSQSKKLMDIQSYVLNKRLALPGPREATVYGAALMAGVSSGLWTKTSIEKIKSKEVPTEYRFKAPMKQRNQIIKTWKKDQKFLINSLNL